ncbi:MAG: very short patch repair endonuclease [Methanobacteriota archaeon]|nr:MAG: very short patch repair endonuclease [Euryarchaeota archaeon]
MSDNLTTEDRRKAMKAVKGKGTSPERRLWAMLARMQINGWHKNVESVIGKPDVVFPQKKIAIFVDGCFWHGCPLCNRKLPQTNRDYWERKISRNIELSRIYNESLRNDGWMVIRIWEHQLRDRNHRKQVMATILQVLEDKS